MGIKRVSGSNRGYVELVYVPAGGLSVDGLTATGCVRGIEPSGLDFDTSNSDYAVSHDAGEPVFCAVAAVEAELITATLQGSIATGANAFRAGDETDSDIYYYAENADANPPFLKYDAGSNQWEFSNDGASTAAIGTAAGSITGGDGISVTSGDIDVDLTDTVTFVQTSSGGGDGGKVMRLESDGFLDLDFLGTTATLTAAKLDTLIDGSNADSLHTHSNPIITAVAAESITADDAVALLPNEVQWYTQLEDASAALFGDSNARRALAIKVIPKVSGTFTDFNFRAREAVNGATALGDLVITFETDNGGEPSGSPVTNGTETISQTTQRTWGASQGTRTATWDGTVSFTAGTTYWIVFTVSATDATNYLLLGINASYDENYITFTRLTYDLDAGTWGGAATNGTPYFWGNSEDVPFGMGLVKTDADFGGRTWPFIGFAKDSVAAEASCDVYYLIVTGLSGLVPGTDYWLSTTAGAITTTKPNGLYGQDAAYKIGRAVSSTDLLIQTGPKRVTISENTITATTTTQYQLWFKPSYMKMSAVGDAGGASSISVGFYDGTNNHSLSEGEGPAGTWSETRQTSASLYIEDPNGGPDTMTGVASAVTDIGFTYTATEAGTVNSFFHIIEVTD